MIQESGSLHYTAHRSNSLGASPTLGWKTRGLYKSGVCDTKPAISLKRSSLEPKLLHSVYRNSCTAYRLLTDLNLVIYGVNFYLLFLGAKFFHKRYLADFCPSATRFGRVTAFGAWPIKTYSLNFVNFDPVVPWYHAATCISPSIIKWFFDNFPMFADSFSVLSIHCVVRGLGASFLYKFSASRGGSLRQHGLLVMFSIYVTFCVFKTLLFCQRFLS